MQQVMSPAKDDQDHKQQVEHENDEPVQDEAKRMVPQEREEPAPSCDRRDAVPGHDRDDEVVEEKGDVADDDEEQQEGQPQSDEKQNRHRRPKPAS